MGVCVHDDRPRFCRNCRVRYYDDRHDPDACEENQRMEAARAELDDWDRAFYIRHPELDTREYIRPLPLPSSGDRRSD